MTTRLKRLCRRAGRERGCLDLKDKAIEGQGRLCESTPIILYPSWTRRCKMREGTRLRDFRSHWGGATQVNQATLLTKLSPWCAYEPRIGVAQTCEPDNEGSIML